MIIESASGKRKQRSRTWTPSRSVGPDHPVTRSRSSVLTVNTRRQRISLASALLGTAENGGSVHDLSRAFPPALDWVTNTCQGFGSPQSTQRTTKPRSLGVQRGSCEPEREPTPGSTAIGKQSKNPFNDPRRKCGSTFWGLCFILVSKRSPAVQPTSGITYLDLRPHLHRLSESIEE